MPHNPRVMKYHFPNFLMSAHNPRVTGNFPELSITLRVIPYGTTASTFSTNDSLHGFNDCMYRNLPSHKILIVFPNVTAGQRNLGDLKDLQTSFGKWTSFTSPSSFTTKSHVQQIFAKDLLRKIVKDLNKKVNKRPWSCCLYTKYILYNE